MTDSNDICTNGQDKLVRFFLTLVAIAMCIAIFIGGGEFLLFLVGETVEHFTP